MRSSPARIRNAEVVSSILICSTISFKHLHEPPFWNAALVVKNAALVEVHDVVAFLRLSLENRLSHA